jgi:hypothetical protein
MCGEGKNRDEEHCRDVVKIDIEARRCRDEQEVWQNERPAAAPCAQKRRAGRRCKSQPEMANARQGLANGDCLAHLLLGHPAALSTDELVLHLADERHMAAEAEQKAKEITDDLRDAAAGSFG